MNKPTVEQLKDPKWWDENAPKWATHYDNGDHGCPWMMLKDDGWYLSGKAKNSEEYHPLTAEIKEDFFPRPAAPEWNGEGRPPVLTKCEATWLELPDGGGRDFERVLIKGYYDHIDALPQVWLTTWGGEDLVLRVENCDFRPLKTKEQRERDELEADLSGILPFLEFTEAQVKEMAEILYAQGYRKPEAKE